MKVELLSSSIVTVATYNVMVDDHPVTYKEYLNDSGRVIDWKIKGLQDQFRDEVVNSIQKIVGNSLVD